MCSASNPVASNPEQQPPQRETHLLSLPEDIVLSCLARVPRNCNLNIAQVCKTLRTFVTSPELNRMRSLLHKSSLYVCFDEINQIGASTHRWLTLEKTTNEYRLVLFPCQHYPFMDRSLAVCVGSDIYFLSNNWQYPSDLWILDTRSGKLSQGPSMKVVLMREAVGVFDGKIYVMGFDRFEDRDEKMQVHVFDPKSKIWKSKGQEKVPPRMWYRSNFNIITASLDLKIYRVEASEISVYNPREGEGVEMVHIVSMRLAESNNPREGRRMERLHKAMDWVCAVENVLYACYDSRGLMWFDTKVKVWRSVVMSLYALEVCRYAKHAVAEYEGKLAIFRLIKHGRVENTKCVKMSLFSFHRVGERILGKIEWSGIVATDPSLSRFSHCLGMII